MKVNDMRKDINDKTDFSYIRRVTLGYFRNHMKIGNIATGDIGIS